MRLGQVTTRQLLADCYRPNGTPSLEDDAKDRRLHAVARRRTERRPVAREGWLSRFGLLDGMT
jgi:hypothetical protein